MALRSPLINVMATAATKAARGLLRDFGEVEQLQVSTKGPSDFVSTADTKAEAAVKAELQKARPRFGMLLEEGGATEGDGEHVWVVDPLDGTTNFLHGIPHFAISIALLRNNQVVAGLIHEPVRDEMFWAERGAGAFMNGRRLRVSARRALNDSIIATGIPHRGRGDHAAFLRELPAVMAQTSGVRRAGSAALDLAYVAAGRYDGFWERALSQWDIAAGILLVREAGGYVSEINGGENMLASGSILAANDQLHRPLLKLLKDARAD